MVGSGIDECEGKKEKGRVDLRNAVGDWVEGKKIKDSNSSFGRLLGIGDGNDGCEGKKEKREGQIFPMLLAIGCKEKKEKDMRV